MTDRDKSGRWQPGQTGNPARSGGRPALPEWFRERGPEALAYLLKVAVGEEEASEKVRLRAVELVVERIYGKAQESITVEGSMAIEKVIREIVYPKDGEG